MSLCFQITPISLFFPKGTSTRSPILSERFFELYVNEKLNTFETFGRGWTRRNKETKETALELIHE